MNLERLSDRSFALVPVLILAMIAASFAGGWAARGVCEPDVARASAASIGEDVALRARSRDGERMPTIAAAASPSAAAAPKLEDSEAQRRSRSLATPSASADESELASRIAQLEAEVASLRLELRSPEERRRPLYDQLASQHYRHEALYREFLPFFLDPELVPEHPEAILPAFLRALDESRIGAQLADDGGGRTLTLEENEEGTSAEINASRGHREWMIEDLRFEMRTLSIGLQLPSIPSSRDPSSREFSGGNATLSIAYGENGLHQLEITLTCDGTEPPRCFGSQYYLQWDPTEDQRMGGNVLRRTGWPDTDSPSETDVRAALRAGDRFVTAFERRIR